jgi:hypothetical protein
MPKAKTDTERDRTDEQDDLRAGRPPHHATLPAGAGRSNVSPQTRTDPNTGAPNPKRGDQR